MELKRDEPGNQTSRLDTSAAVPPPPPPAPGAREALHKTLHRPEPKQAVVPPAPAGPGAPIHQMVLRSGDLRRQQERGQSPYNARKRYEEIYRYVQPPQEASYASFPASVAAPVADLLTMGGKRTPYSHQAQVASLILDEGRNVSLRTPTASGKTVSFLAPTLTILHDDPRAVALMVYPVNALAADQFKNLLDLGFTADSVVPGMARMKVGDRTIVAGVLNGDSPESARKMIRQTANMILTNPVALHMTALANANHSYRDGTSWNRVLSNIRMVVLDESHTQTGVGGTQTALAFRRLQALSEVRSGRSFQVILSSATIGNPIDHAQALTGMGNWASVDRSGARTQERTVVMINPAEHPSGNDRWSPSVVIEELAVAEYLAGRPTIIFCPSRSATGRLADRINDAAGGDVCLAFHSGLPPSLKREATQKVLRGEVPIVAATSALEVGVDIGSMETCILYGHPGDNASFNQRVGRVGRTSPGTVYVVLDEGQDAINAYLAVNPKALNGAPEARTVYPENKNLALQHAACALLETGRPEVVGKYFPGLNMNEVLAAARSMPHAAIDMSGGLGDFGQFIALTPDQKELQKLGGQDALLNWHKGAVIRSTYGKCFIVTGIDLGSQRVLTESMPEGVVRTYTTPKKSRTVDGSNYESIGIPGVDGVKDARQGDFYVAQQTTAYRQYIFEKGSKRPLVVDHDLEAEDRNPTIAFDTRGVELVIGRENPVVDALLGLGDSEKLCDALGDVMRKTLPLVVQARSLDLDLEVKADGEGSVRFVFFDMANGGMGWSESAAHRFGDWLDAAGTLLKRCSCALQGCPKCTFASITPSDRRDLANSILMLRRR